MTSVPTLSLNDGTTIPQLGFGVFQVEPDQTSEVVSQAFEVGYRHIDTAQMYGNEKGVGEAIASSDIPRDQLFVTTKLNNDAHRPEDARRAIAQSVEDLGTTPDLFLIHWPLPTQYDGDFVATWQALISAREEGLTRSIGVSNFQVPHLDELAAATDVVPAVNQVEAHPFFGNQAVRTRNAAAGIVTEAWSPIAQGKVIDDPTVREIAERVGRTPSQVTLRWHLQRGDVVFPKSTHLERMRENFELFDFELGSEDVAALSALDRGEDGRIGPNPDTFDRI